MAADPSDVRKAVLLRQLKLNEDDHVSIDDDNQYEEDDHDDQVWVNDIEDDEIDANIVAIDVTQTRKKLYGRDRTVWTKNSTPDTSAASLHVIIPSRRGPAAALVEGLTPDVTVTGKATMFSFSLRQKFSK